MPRFLRVYNNGDQVTEDEATHNYSLQFRPGCALFKDGKCVQAGYLDAERIALIEVRLMPMSKRLLHSPC